MRAWLCVALGAAALAAACNFDAAFNRYCENNPLCSLDGGSPGEPWPVPRNCSQCSSDEVCNPFGKVCMHVCTSAADCPVGEEACALLLDSSGNPLAQMTCTCTSSSCGGSAQCSQVDNLCEERCSTNADCTSFQPPRLCNDGMCLQPAQ